MKASKEVLLRQIVARQDRSANSRCRQQLRRRQREQALGAVEQRILEDGVRELTATVDERLALAKAGAMIDDISNQNLSNQDLSNCNLTGCNLVGCNLRSANLSGKFFSPISMARLQAAV